MELLMEFLMELHGLFLVIQLYTVVHHHSQLLTIMNHHQPSLSLTFINIHEHSLFMDIHHHFITFRPPLRVTHPPVPLLDAFPAHLECRLQRRAEPELPQGFDAGMAPRAGATDLLMDRWLSHLTIWLG